MTSAGTAGVAVSVGCRGDIATGAVGVAISLAGDGERDLENKPELLRTMEEDDGDLLLDGSAGTSLTSDGRSSLLILPCGSHNFVFSLLIVDVLVVDDEELDSKDERILEMDAVPPVTVGSATVLGVSDDPSNESEWNSERAFLTTDGLPSTGLAIDNRLPLLFNGEVADSTAPSIGIVVVTDNFLGRCKRFSSRGGRTTSSSSTGVSSSCAAAGGKSSASSATPFVCGGGATGSSSSSSPLAGFWSSGAGGGGDGE